MYTSCGLYFHQGLKFIPKLQNIHIIISYTFYTITQQHLRLFTQYNSFRLRNKNTYNH